MENQPITAEAQSRPVRSILGQGAQLLGEAGIKSAWLDAEVLLCHVQGVEKAQLYSNGQAELGVSEEKRYRESIRRRAKREPVAYITGRKEFWSLDFFVTPRVLVPRPETERVVEVALERVKQNCGESVVDILDIGTGSGVLAVCLAKELSAARLWAVDVSAAALEVARKNSERHGVAGKIQFLQGNLFEPLAGSLFDLIVSNPPYIKSGELAGLAQEIRCWEPLEALDGGADGLDFYREIIEGAHHYLNPGGHLVLEIGADMGEGVARLIACVDQYSRVTIHQDYAGHDRVIATSKETPGGAPRGLVHG